MNNKQRKLKYIREKNRLRLGGYGSFYFVATNELLDDSVYLESHVEYELSKISKKYKLPFFISEVIMGQNGDNFLRGVTTIYCYFKKA